MTGPRCANPDCVNPVPRRPGQPGRPPIYCTPACRPSHQSPAVTITIDPTTSDDDRPPRHYYVRLHRGPNTVTLAADLGRFAATDLADRIAHLLALTPPTTTID